MKTRHKWLAEYQHKWLVSVISVLVHRNKLINKRVNIAESNYHVICNSKSIKVHESWY